MIIQCQSCSSKYFLPEEKVPVNPLKVRCPKCRAVFMLAARTEREQVAVAPAAPAAEPVRTMRKFGGRDHDLPASVAVAPLPVEIPVVSEPAPVAAVTQEAPAPVVEPVVAAAPRPVVQEAPVAAREVLPAAAPAPKSGTRGGKSADDRAKRLARVLVSDILWYNRERRDAALRDGTLMTSLGEEIKKSWELYKEKVGPEAAHSTNYFKEALNEILANGQQVF